MGDRSRDRRRSRFRSESRSRSRSKNRVDNKISKSSLDTTNKRWDGWRWVDVNAAPSSSDPMKSAAQAGVKMHPSMGGYVDAARDRKIYVGNLPLAATND